MAPTSTVSYLGGIHAPDDVYRGHDVELGVPVQLKVGDEADVSQAKADQLAADFPGCFEIDGKVAGKRPSPAKPSEPASEEDELRKQLLEHKRAELNAAAAELGIVDAEAMPNKAAVVDAIVAAKASAEE